MGGKNIVEKTLESYNDVFADIVNGFLFQGKGVLQEHMLTDASPQSMYKADGKPHEQERYVAKYWQDTTGQLTNIRIVFWGIENQTGYDKDMPLRIIDYDGAAYQAESYPVLTIILYFGDTPWGRHRSLSDVLKIPDILRPYINDYSINLFDIPHLPEETVEYFHSDFRVVVDYFIHHRKDPEYRPADEVRFQHVDELLKFLAFITQDKHFEDALFWEEGKPENMNNLLDRIKKKGIAR